MRIRNKTAYSCLNSLRSNRGTALVTVFAIIMVLTALGAGMLVLIQANATQTRIADTQERVYYMAEGCAQQAVDQLKRATLSTYSDLATLRLNDGSSGSTYATAKGNFFGSGNNQYSVARRAFGAPTSGVYAYTPTDLGTGVSATITPTGDPSTGSLTYIVESTATVGTATKKATASLVVSSPDVKYLKTQSKIDPSLLDYLFGDDSTAAVLLGGTLDFSGLPSSPVKADLHGTHRPVICAGRLIPDDPSQLSCSPDDNWFWGSAKKISSSIIDKLNWYIEYSMLYNDGDDTRENGYRSAFNIVDTYPGAVNASAKHTLLDTATGQSVRVPAGSVIKPTGLYQNMVNPTTGVTELTLNPAFTLKPTDYPADTNQIFKRKLYLMGAARPSPSVKASYTLQDMSFKYDASNSYMTDGYIYADGDLTLERCLINNAFIHCTGDLYVTNSELTGCTIYCDGNVYIKSDPSAAGYSSWRTIILTFLNYILGSSGPNYLRDNPNLIYSKYDMTFDGNNLNGYYYIGRDLYANNGDMSIRPASIIYVTRNAYLSPTAQAYKYRGMLYSFGNVTVDGPVDIDGQLAARGNLSIARGNSAGKLTVDFGAGNALTSELEDLLGSSTRFTNSNFNKAAYIDDAVPQVVIPKSSEIFTSETSVKPK